MSKPRPSSDAVAVALESAKYGDTFTERPIPAGGRGTPPLRMWRNRRFLVQLFQDDGYERLSINRAALDSATGRWVDGITWDELMFCKRAVGFGDRWAVEAYPPDAEVVNVASIRHLFLLPAAPEWAWTKDRR